MIVGDLYEIRVEMHIILARKGEGKQMAATTATANWLTTRSRIAPRTH